MSDRKAELERKRERLRQIKAEKERRQAERQAADAERASARATSGEAASLGAHQDINQQLRDIGITPVDVVLDSLPAAGSSGAPSLGDQASLGAGGDPSSGAEGAGDESPAMKRGVRKPLSLGK